MQNCPRIYEDSAGESIRSLSTLPELTTGDRRNIFHCTGITHQISNFLGVAGLHASVSTLFDVGIVDIEAHVRSVTQHLIERVRWPDLPIITPDDPHARAGIVTSRVSDGPRLFETLKVNNIQVSFREECIRISPHFYNTIEEIDQTMEVLHATLNR